MSPTPRSRLSLLGFIVIRLVIPLWIATGAVFKLVEAEPSLLPRNTVFPIGADIGGVLGMDIDQIMGLVVSLELLMVAIMLIVPRLARLTAIAQLAVFCTVLLIEGFGHGNWAKCGCFGANSPPPWMMLSFDAVLLLLACTLPMPKSPARTLPRLAIAFAVAVACAVVAFVRIAAIPDPGAAAPPPDTTAILARTSPNDFPYNSRPHSLTS